MSISLLELGEALPQRPVAVPLPTSPNVSWRDSIPEEFAAGSPAFNNGFYKDPVTNKLYARENYSYGTEFRDDCTKHHFSRDDLSPAGTGNPFAGNIELRVDSSSSSYFYVTTKPIYRGQEIMMPCPLPNHPRPEAYDDLLAARETAISERDRLDTEGYRKEYLSPNSAHIDLHTELLRSRAHAAELETAVIEANRGLMYYDSVVIYEKSPQMVALGLFYDNYPTNRDNNGADAEAIGAYGRHMDRYNIYFIMQTRDSQDQPVWAEYLLRDPSGFDHAHHHLSRITSGDDSPESPLLVHYDTRSRCPANRSTRLMVFENSTFHRSAGSISPLPDGPIVLDVRGINWRMIVMEGIPGQVHIVPTIFNAHMSNDADLQEGDAEDEHPYFRVDHLFDDAGHRRFMDIPVPFITLEQSEDGEVTWPLFMGPRVIHERCPLISDGNKRLDLTGTQIPWIMSLPLHCVEPAEGEYSLWNATRMHENRSESATGSTAALRVFSKSLASAGTNTPLKASYNLSLAIRYKNGIRAKPIVQCVSAFGIRSFSYISDDTEKQLIRGGGARAILPSLENHNANPDNAFFSTSLYAATIDNRLPTASVADGQLGSCSSCAAMVSAYTVLHLKMKPGLGYTTDAHSLLVHDNLGAYAAQFDRLGNSRKNILAHMEEGMMRELELGMWGPVPNADAPYTPGGLDHILRMKYHEDLGTSVPNIADCINYIRLPTSVGVEVYANAVHTGIYIYLLAGYDSPASSDANFISACDALNLRMSVAGTAPNGVNNAFIADVSLWEEITLTVNWFSQFFRLDQVYGSTFSSSTQQNQSTALYKEWTRLMGVVTPAMAHVVTSADTARDQMSLYNNIDNDTHVSVFHLIQAAYTATHIVFAATFFCASGGDTQIDDAVTPGLRAAITGIFKKMVEVFATCNEAQIGINNLQKLVEKGNIEAEHDIRKYNQQIITDREGFLTATYKDSDVKRKQLGRFNKLKERVGYFNPTAGTRGVGPGPGPKLTYSLINEGNEPESLAAEIYQIIKYYNNAWPDGTPVDADVVETLQKTVRYDFSQYGASSVTDNAKDAHRCLCFARAGLQQPKHTLDEIKKLYEPKASPPPLPDLLEAIHTIGYFVAGSECPFDMDGELYQRLPITSRNRRYKIPEYSGMVCLRIETPSELFIMYNSSDNYALNDAEDEPSLHETVRFYSDLEYLVLDSGIEFEIMSGHPDGITYSARAYDGSLSGAVIEIEANIDRTVPVNVYWTQILDGHGQRIRGIRYTGHEIIQGYDGEQLPPNSITCAYPLFLIHEKVFDDLLANTAKKKYWEQYALPVVFGDDAPNQVKYVGIPCEWFDSPRTASEEYIVSRLIEEPKGYQFDFCDGRKMVAHPCVNQDDEPYHLNLHLAGHLSNEPVVNQIVETVRQHSSPPNVFSILPLPPRGGQAALSPRHKLEIDDMRSSSGQWVRFYASTYALQTSTSTKDGAVGKVVHGDELVWCYGNNDDYPRDYGIDLLSTACRYV